MCAGFSAEAHRSRLALALSVCALLGACAGPDTLTPQAWTGYVPPGGDDEFQIRIRLPEDPPSLERVDILLLFDVTQSMREAIGELRANAGSILRAIRARNPNGAFGVGSFADYRQKMPWRLDRDVTDDVDAAVQAIARLKLYEGKDSPAAYSRALHEARFVGWRPGARRVILLFGDAPARDPNFYGESTGVDPGRDGIPNTDDDLRFVEVVRDLAVDRTVVLSYYVPGDDRARKGFEFLAAQTGGAAIPARDVKQLPAAIVTSLSEQSFALPQIAVPPEFADWVGVATGKRTRRGELREYLYTIRVAVPRRATSGIRRLRLSAGYEEATRSVEIGSTRVTLLTGPRYHPLWRWLLAAIGFLMLLAWRRRLLRRSFRFLHAGHYARLGLRTAELAVFLFLVYLGWRYLEGAETLLPWA